MPKKIPEKDFENILNTVAKFPAGVLCKELNITLNRKYIPRTLRRYLHILVQTGRLAVKDRGRSTRYYIPNERDDLKPAGNAAVIPVSAAAEKLRLMIRKPPHLRKPVGYAREFLEEYLPNTTCYLPAKICEQLRVTGETPDAKLPAGTYARQILDRLLIDLSWNSSRLEGNTYSLLETQLLLEKGESADDKDASEAQMILNHKAAIEFLVDEEVETDFNAYTILNLHALLSDNLLSDPSACGKLRKRTVSIGKSVYHPLEVPQSIEEYFSKLLEKAQAIQNPFEQAFFALVHIAYLQPFEDVNKRVSRLAANIPLIRYNLCPLSFIDVPQDIYTEGMLAVYESNRIELIRDVFIWAYKRSAARYSAVCQSLGAPDPFRLKNRRAVKELVADIVRKKPDKKETSSYIRKRAADMVSEEDEPKFTEVIETELMNLHIGNIARYQLKPNEFKIWKDVWR